MDWGPCKVFAVADALLQLCPSPHSAQPSTHSRMRAGRRASHSGRSYPRSGREESGHTLDSPTVRYQTVDDGSPATSLGSSLYSSCSSAATEYEANPQFNDPEFDSDAEDAKDKFLYVSVILPHPHWASLTVQRYCYQCPFAVDRKDAWIPYDRQLWRCLVFHNC